MKVRTDYADNPDITPGKLYEVTKYDPKEPGDLCAGAEIADDTGFIIYILLSDTPECGFLDCKGVWEVVEEG